MILSLHLKRFKKTFIEMPKKKTSVLFINSDGKQKKSVQIPTLILFHWRKIILGLVLLLTVTITVLGFMIHDKTSEYYTLMFTEKLRKANQVKNSIDIDKAKASFTQIDSSMFRINEFLDKRGLDNWKLENVGGISDFDITEIDEVAQEYEDKILKVEDLVQQIPMGKPNQGRITSKFGYRSNPFTGKNVEHHSGIDFKGEIGTPIKATAAGKVIYAARRGGYGNCVIIKHNKELKTLFAHMNEILVQNGQHIDVGDIVGTLGSTGRSTGPHLHYEIYKNDERIDPEAFLDTY